MNTVGKAKTVHIAEPKNHPSLVKIAVDSSAANHFSLIQNPIFAPGSFKFYPYENPHQRCIHSIAPVYGRHGVACAAAASFVYVPHRTF